MSIKELVLTLAIMLVLVAVLVPRDIGSSFRVYKPWHPAGMKRLLPDVIHVTEQDARNIHERSPSLNVRPSLLLSGLGFGFYFKENVNIDAPQ